jgi:Outer membrane protein beta-barrel domain
MKKLFAILFFTACFAQLASAQFGVSAGALYGSETKKLGFTGRLNYDITSDISIYAGYSALGSETVTGGLFGDITASSSAIDIDGHYHFSEGTTRPYALAGLSLISASVSFGGVSAGSGSTTGINVGGGVLHNLSEKLGLFLEAKYVIVTGGQIVATAGIHYGF